VIPCNRRGTPRDEFPRVARQAKTRDGLTLPGSGGSTVLRWVRRARLGIRNVADVSSIGSNGRARVKARGASLKATEQPIDTGTAAGKCFLDMLGVFAEFETNLRRERQLEGIAKAKAEGVYKGRPDSIDAAQVREMKAQGLGATEIAKALKIGRASVYRVLEAG
jgi:DNA invertase Pin-like site-specific DNA recombinase